MIDPLEHGLLPVTRLAPSRFAAFVACSLREVLRAAGVPRVLSSVGAAHLGTVVHELLERAGSHDGLTAPEAEQLFDDLVAREEEKLLADVRTRAAVPLVRSVRNFEVRKRRAIHAAIASTGRRASREPHSGARARTGAEMWVQSHDGAVGGFIDEVVSRDGKIVIRDFKSGAAGQPASGTFTSAKQQLELYAALYAETMGTWPASMEIVPVDGAAIPLAVDPPTCQELLEHARELLVACNAVVAAAPRPEADFRLGRPSAATCRQCDFRPICHAYRAARTPDGEWPRDVIGTITRRDALRNGTTLFAVDDPRTGHVVVRGVTEHHARFDDLASFTVGAVAGFFNLTGGREGGSYAASPVTTAVTLKTESTAR